jgi:hypothetical protein
MPFFLLLFVGIGTHQYIQLAVSILLGKSQIWKLDPSAKRKYGRGY